MSKAKSLEELILACLITTTGKKNITNLAAEIRKSKGHVKRAVGKMVQDGLVTINKDWIGADLNPRSNIIELQWKGFAYGVVKYNIEAHDYLDRNHDILSKIQRKVFREISHIRDVSLRQLTWWYSLEYWLKTGNLSGYKFHDYVAHRVVSDNRYRKAPFSAALKTYEKTNLRETGADRLRLKKRIQKNISRVGKVTKV